MTAGRRGYRPTESKYEGGASEMYVAYDLDQRTRGGSTATHPKVKRVYIAGDVKGWEAGRVRKKTGREVCGVRIEYERGRRGYTRGGPGREAAVPPTSQRFAQVVEIPEAARNVEFFSDAAELPERYRHALQRVR